MKIEGLDHVAITVRDPLSSMVWYQDVLGLERRFEEAWGDYPIVMLAGERRSPVPREFGRSAHGAG